VCVCVRGGVSLMMWLRIVAECNERETCALSAVAGVAGQAAARVQTVSVATSRRHTALVNSRPTLVNI